MGAYFRCYLKGKSYIKTLIKKRGGSLYPSLVEFSERVNLLKKYLRDFMPETEINYDGRYIRIKQDKIIGEDIFDFLKIHKEEEIKEFSQFIKGLNNLYQKTSMLPDLLNKRNILITKNKEIKIIDVWPLFFKERKTTGDINEESYKENMDKFKFLIAQHQK